jgi:prepilin-type N-terminal cleavage/methylation domain-containing protein
MTPAGRRTPPAEDGFALIEVLVSALILAIVAGAVLNLLQASARSAGDQRHHSEAYALAQEDQARLREMRLSNLSRLPNKPQEIKLDGTLFSIASSGVFVNNKSGTASCVAGENSSDYVQITSTVSWPSTSGRKPVVIQSIVSPSSGSIDSTHGTLSINATNAKGGPLAGVGISGKGPTTFSGTTDATGCANFADLPEGNYTLTPSAPGLVNKFGEAPKAQTVGVLANNTLPVGLEYDIPGTLEVKFKYRVGSTTEFKASSANSIMVYHPISMKTVTAFKTTGGAAEPIVKAKELFPSKEPFAAYAGSCTSNDPNPKSEKEAPGAAATVGVYVQPGAGSLPPIPEIQLPALNLTVKSGTSMVSGAKVKVTGTCSFERTYTTIAGGLLPDPGLPWGAYEVCASAKVPEGKIETQRRIKTTSAVTVQSLSSGTTLNLDLSGTGSESGSTKVC